MPPFRRSREALRAGERGRRAARFGAGIVALTCLCRGWFHGSVRARRADGPALAPFRCTRPRPYRSFNGRGECLRRGVECPQPVRVPQIAAAPRPAIGFSACDEHRRGGKTFRSIARLLPRFGYELKMSTCRDASCGSGLIRVAWSTVRETIEPGFCATTVAVRGKSVTRGRVAKGGVSDDDKHFR